MKNLKSVLGAAGMLALSVFMVACSSDDEPSYSTSAVTNSELATILKSKGYQLNEQGQLLLDDKAQQTTTLDLSGTNIPTDAFAELSILPNLTEVDLSDNGYGPAFDFSTLPAQITGVDLTDNEIYDYDNLVSVEVAENGDETVTMLHNITKLYLPAEAKDNIKQLMRFYRENKTAIEDGTMDVMMVNASGTLEKYNTLRSVPDETLRAYLKEKYSTIFDGDQIDLSKRFSNSEKINELTLNPYVLEMSKVSSLEGIQYIVNNPYWESTSIYINSIETLSLPKLVLNEKVTFINLLNVSVANGLDISNATSIYSISLNNVSGIESLDLTLNKVWGQRELSIEENDAYGSTLSILDCADFKELILPSATTLRASTVDIEYVGGLTALDLSKLIFVKTLILGDLADNCALIYPVLSEFDSDFGQSAFDCSQKTYDLSSTKTFINKYFTNSDEPRIYGNYSMTCSKNEPVYWEYM